MADKATGNAEKATGTNKTTPNLREKASENRFAKDFLVHIDDSSKVPAKLVEDNKPAVVLAAEQRGLRTTGDVSLDSKKVVDKHNVLLVYTVEVEPATDQK